VKENRVRTAISSDWSSHHPLSRLSGWIFSHDEGPILTLNTFDEDIQKLSQTEWLKNLALTMNSSPKASACCRLKTLELKLTIILDGNVVSRMTLTTARWLGRIWRIRGLVEHFLFFF